MNKTVLVASDEMRLCNVLKAIKDLEFRKKAVKNVGVNKKVKKI